MADNDQDLELYGPDDEGWYTSQTADWIPLCPELSDAAVRLYWILRALVIEKRGPVRKLTLMELAYMLPKRKHKRGEKALPSSMSRIRGLLRELTDVRLVTTPEGRPLKTSSRAKAAAAGALRIRINQFPDRGYPGPRNAFDALDAVREKAAQASREAAAKEAAREQQKKAERRRSSADETAGQNSDPPGQDSDPRGQNSDPDLGAEQEERDPPFRLPTQSSRSQHPLSVRPSLPVGDARTREDGTDGGTAPGAEDEQPDKTVPAPRDPQRLISRTPGMQLLLAIGAENERYLLWGLPLLHQSLVVDGMLEEGWTRQQVRHVVCGRPLPEVIETSVGAIISARLRAAARTGPPAAAPPIPAQTAPPPDQSDGASGTPAARSVIEAVGHRAMAECTGCGRAGRAPGAELCPTCLDWPECSACTGPSPRRANPATGGVCSKCLTEGALPQLPVAEADRHDGSVRCTGCGTGDDVDADSQFCPRCTQEARELVPELMTGLDQGGRGEKLALRLLRNTSRGKGEAAVAS
ncbi:hypothetical protein [Streptomyces sp. 3N207]|uniref:hypothetical protein n=1 Tax=Streptomyces sp. 3N207 TaxID=3457417 RepID=UPI003FCFC589